MGRRRCHQFLTSASILLMGSALITLSEAAAQSGLERIISGANEANHFIRQMLPGHYRRDRDERMRTVTSNSRRKSTEIQVCVVGLGRTGSTSIYTALQQLGYTPLHDHERLEIADLLAAKFDDRNPITVDEFATELGRRGFDSILYYGYDFVEWCVENKRKVILTIRDDPIQWAKSWLRVIPLIDLLEGRPFIWSKTVQQILPSMLYVCKDVPTGGKPEQYKTLEVLVEGYEKHNARVRNMVPPELLLEFNAKDGWSPLCNFLGKDSIPESDYPHVNDKVAMRAALTIFYAISLLWPLLPILLAVLLWRALRILGRNSKRKLNTKES